MNLIDSHCHLDFKIFDLDRDAVINSCQQIGLQHIIVPGVTAASWPRLLDITQQYSILEPALGLHPMFMPQHHTADIEQLKQALEQHHIMAIGEIGLDFYIDNHDKEAQIALVTAQLKLAQQFDLPVILHVRKAHDQMIQLLKRYPVKGGIVHAFSGSEQQAHNYIKLNILFGIGGACTYPRATRLQKLITSLPLERLVLETDSPDMPLYGQQGQRNSPENMVKIVNFISSLRPESPEKVAKITTDNCKQLFNL